MGRTLPTYRNVLESLISDWSGFRRALRAQDKERFDRLMDKARRHAHAATYDVRPDPTYSMFMSILLEMEGEIEELKRRIERHDQGLAD